MVTVAKYHSMIIRDEYENFITFYITRTIELLIAPLFISGIIWQGTKTLNGYSDETMEEIDKIIEKEDEKKDENK
jgi:hypothetical protein